jgi:hypothetical protein
MKFLGHDYDHARFRPIQRIPPSLYAPNKDWSDHVLDAAWLT